MLTLSPTTGSFLQIEVPYPLGKHFLKVENFLGKLSWDESIEAITSGTLSVNLEEFTTKDQTLYCHFLEAMTLDYNISDYPKKHVCSGDKMPTVGKNAPKYKTVSATITKPAKNSDVLLSVKWLMRDIQKEMQIPVKMEWDKEERNLRIISQWKMSRSDFGIVVKKFLFIEAENTLNLKLDLTLAL